MADWALGLLVAGACLVMVLFTYMMCMTLFQFEEVLPRWAKQHGFRIIRRELRTFFQGPFFLNKFKPVYYVTVEDQQRRQQKGWVRLGFWYVIGFKENIEVHWEN